MIIDEKLLYTKTHEWVKIENDKAFIGLTDFAQEQLGDIVFVELPEVDDEVEAGGQLSIVESVKTVVTVYAPLTGVVASVNHDLEETPELLNKSPYESCIGVIRFNDEEQIKELLRPAEYQVICEEEA